MGPQLGDLAEALLLRAAERRAAATPAELRARVARAHLQARQLRRAAETLWSAGSPAAALRLLREADATLRALDPGDAPARDLPDPYAEPDPELDEDVGPAHGEVYHARLDALERDMAARLGEELDVRSIRRMRLLRSALAAVAALALVLALVQVARARRQLGVEASAQFDAEHAAARATDDSGLTEWLLPDAVGGWLEVTIAPARHVTRIRVTNARNLPWADRAAREVHVEVSYQGRVVRELDDTLDAPSAEPAPRTYDVAAKIDRVRIDIRSHHGLGGGLAEVAIE